MTQEDRPEFLEEVTPKRRPECRVQTEILCACVRGIMGIRKNRLEEIEYRDYWGIRSKSGPREINHEWIMRKRALTGRNEGRSLSILHKEVTKEQEFYGSVTNQVTLDQ